MAAPGPAGVSAGSVLAEAPQRTELAHPCSRLTSRHVRKQLEKEVLRPAARAGLSAWPPGCPLDPARDLYGRQEKQKHRKRGSGTLWTCGICGKVFKSEHYLDLHLERKHTSEMPVSGICLADYCDIFDVCHGEPGFRHSPRRDDKDGKVEPTCDNTTLARARGRCETAMGRCFPLDQDASRKLHAKLSRQWCRVLDCRIREEQQREQHSDLMPVVVLLILIVLVCFVVFSVIVCCVDYSDDILAFLLQSRLASTGLVQRLLKAREKTRESFGMDRTKAI